MSMRDSTDVVILTPLYMPHLVFHARDRDVDRFREIKDIRLNGAGFTNEPIQVLTATACGLPLFYCTYDEEREEHNRDGRARGTMIRYGYALRIARPCMKCFPNHPRIYRSYDEYLDEVRPDNEETP